jgi:hypothetical protein
MLRWLLPACLAVSAAFVEADARACGGCFHPPNPPPPERSVVTGHRMAFSISTTQTVLWDQIRYSGNPREFAWVLPVKPGAVIQSSRDEWFAALDAATQPVISAPVTYASPQGAGCALLACGSSASSADNASGGSGGTPGVQVLAQGVVGPYDTVTLQSSNPNALTDWLTSHSFDIPATIAPTIAYYVAGGFDFIAVRLRPDCGVSAMQPVRIVTPGADPTLPLRMVAAGAGANVDIVLWVLGEGRWGPQNFPAVEMNETQIIWDSTQEISNYESLAQSLMAQNGGSWLTEYAQVIEPYAFSAPTGAPNPSLYQAYYAFCGGASPSNGSQVVRPQPCDQTGALDASFEAAADADAGASDAADADAGASDAADADAGASDAADASESDAGESDAGQSDAGQGEAGQSNDPCQAFDDLDVATLGIDPTSTWLTRMRTSLPVEALATDLVLTATSQTQVSNVHHAQATTAAANEGASGACESSTQRHEAFGSVTLLAVTVAGLAAMLRRRKRSLR